MDGQYIVFAIICGEAMAVWAKLDFCGEGKCNARASALGIDIVETGHFAQILGRKASKKYLSSVAIFPFLRCQNKSRQF